MVSENKNSNPRKGESNMDYIIETENLTKRYGTATVVDKVNLHVPIAAYLFSREYTESTLKTILPIPISRTKLLIGKFCTLLLWIVMLTLVTWAGIFIVCGLYDAVFTLEGYSLLVAIVWLPKFLFGS